MMQSLKPKELDLRMSNWDWIHLKKILTCNWNVFVLNSHFSLNFTFWKNSSKIKKLMNVRLSSNTYAVNTKHFRFLVEVKFKKCWIYFSKITGKPNWFNQCSWKNDQFLLWKYNFFHDNINVENDIPGQNVRFCSWQITHPQNVSSNREICNKIRTNIARNPMTIAKNKIQIFLLIWDKLSQSRIS